MNLQPTRPHVKRPHVKRPDEFARYPWDLMPADRRDRAIVLAIARREGILPRWADRDLRARDRIARLENMVAVLLSRRAS